MCDVAFLYMRDKRGQEQQRALDLYLWHDSFTHMPATTHLHVKHMCDVTSLYARHEQGQEQKRALDVQRRSIEKVPTFHMVDITRLCVWKIKIANRGVY